MKYLFGFVILLLACAVSSCIKRPVINLFGTHPDPGKFECKVNGAEYLPYDGKFYIFAPVTVRVFSLPGGHQLSVKTTVYNDNTPSRIIDLNIANVTGTGIYEFNAPFQYATYVYKAYYATAQPGHGNITLTTYDTVAKVISGTFQFNAINSNNPADSVKVTAGHFNLSYTTM